MRLRWSKHGANNIPIGRDFGHPDNPEMWTSQKEYYGSPEWGDKTTAEHYYREYPDISQPLVMERYGHLIVGCVFWFYQFYNLYWNYKDLIGHWYLPYQYEFSDEELGIPPDDAPDPEYWGNHGKAYGTYR